MTVGKWSSGDFIDGSMLTDHMSEKSELKVRKHEAMNYRCDGTGLGRWSGGWS